MVRASDDTASDRPRVERDQPRTYRRRRVVRDATHQGFGRDTVDERPTYGLFRTRRRRCETGTKRERDLPRVRRQLRTTDDERDDDRVGRFVRGKIRRRRLDFGPGRRCERVVVDNARRGRVHF